VTSRSGRIWAKKVGILQFWSFLVKKRGLRNLSWFASSFHNSIKSKTYFWGSPFWELEQAGWDRILSVFPRYRVFEINASATHDRVQAAPLPDDYQSSFNFLIPLRSLRITRPAYRLCGMIVILEPQLPTSLPCDSSIRKRRHGRLLAQDF
jgi:hypothetical protein